MKQKVLIAALVGVGAALAAGSLEAQQVKPLEYPRPHTRDGRPWNHGEVFKEVLAEQGKQFKVHPATQTPEHLVTPDDIRRWEKELSNWGRWGPDDRRGTLNLITPEKTVEAARLIREGRSVSLQIFPGNVNFRRSADSWRHTESAHWMTAIDPVTGEPRGALDAVRFGLHDGVVSHQDALCHYWGAKSSPSRQLPDQEKVTYNGYPFKLNPRGCSVLGIDQQGPGGMSRAVLFDIPLLKGVDYLNPSTPIFVEDLEAWEKRAGVRIGAGDVMILRTGRWALREAEGPWNMSQGGAGLHASVLPWLHARGVALLVSDARAGVVPSGVDGSPVPIHQMTQVILGLPLVDNGWTEDVAQVAQELRRWEFAVTWKLLHIPGGTASPFNALAIF